MIRRGFIEADLIEAIVVLPGKLFYGNNVPGCLVLLNKAKPAGAQGQDPDDLGVASLPEGQPAEPAAASDLMRILVPWRAFGDLEIAAAWWPSTRHN